MADTLLVTVAIGAQYQEQYRSQFHGNHRAYADRCGYDLMVCGDFLDPRNPHPCFISLQKILVCSQEFSGRYRTIIYVDADILFNLRRATPLHLVAERRDQVYIANEYSQPTPALRLEIQRRCNWEKNAAEYYKLAGLEIETDRVLNTGLMIFNPQAHRDLLDGIYQSAIASGYNHPRGFHYEQAMVGYGLQKSGRYELLPNEWNAIWLLQKLAPGNTLDLPAFLAQNKAVHFAGNCDLQEIPRLVSAYYQAP